MKLLLPFALFFSFFLLFSCGKKSSGGGKKVQQQTVEADGVYSAILSPLNQKTSKTLTSFVTISKLGDEFIVRVKFNDGPTGTHKQGLYSGVACPTVDVDGDGWIDAAESEKDLGRLLIPFDGDIGNRNLGQELYPNTDNYDYERSTSYALMVSDLDPIDRDLKLNGRVVVIHGVTEDQRVVPIACGVLSTMAIEPEEDDSQEEPNPPDVLKPKPTHKPDHHVEPQPEPEESKPNFFERLRNRLVRWWRKLTGGHRRHRDD